MNLDLAIAYADVPGFPAGSVVDRVVATITGSDGVSHSQTLAANAASVSFADVAADTYSYFVGALDAAGGALGNPVTGTFVVAAPATVTLSLPSAVTASQS